MTEQWQGDITKIFLQWLIEEYIAGLDRGSIKNNQEIQGNTRVRCQSQVLAQLTVWEVMPFANLEKAENGNYRDNSAGLFGPVKV